MNSGAFLRIQMRAPNRNPRSSDWKYRVLFTYFVLNVGRQWTFERVVQFFMIVIPRVISFPDAERRIVELKAMKSLWFELTRWKSTVKAFVIPKYTDMTLMVWSMFKMQFVRSNDSEKVVCQPERSPLDPFVLYGNSTRFSSWSASGWRAERMDRVVYVVLISFIIFIRTLIYC